MVFIEADLAIEGIDLGGAAVGEDMDDTLGLEGEGRFASRQGVHRVDVNLRGLQVALQE